MPCPCHSHVFQQLFHKNKMKAQNNGESFGKVFKCLPGLQIAWHRFPALQQWFCWWEWSSWWSPSENTSDCATWPRWCRCHIHAVCPSLCTCHLWRQKPYISKEIPACIILMDFGRQTISYEGVRVTLKVFSIEMSSMAAVHPPAGPFLQGTVLCELVIVFVRCTELHAIVRCVEFVTGIVAKVITIKGITGISAKVISVRQAVEINFWSKFESGVVGIPEKARQTRQICDKHSTYWLLCTLMFSSMFDLTEEVRKFYFAKINFGNRAKSCLTAADKENSCILNKWISHQMHSCNINHRA